MNAARSIAAWAVAAAVLSGCGLPSPDSPVPSGPGASADAVDARRSVERSCPGGEVERVGGDGTSPADYRCRRED